MAQFVIVALNLTIVIMTLGVFGKQFTARCNEEIQKYASTKVNMAWLKDKGTIGVLMQVT